MRTFVFNDGTSRRFWNIELEGSSYTLTYGNADSPGRSRTREFDSPEEAQREYDKAIRTKLRAGYVETTSATAPPASLREALEAALTENPDDLAAHMAYADLLSEEGDLRGEFIQVQLALEDESLGTRARKQLERREKELLSEYYEDWLGELAKPLLQNVETCPRLQFRRGWLSLLEIGADPSPSLARLLAESPRLRLLERLHILQDPYEPDPYPEEPRVWDAVGTSFLYPLTRARHLGNVRFLQLGDPSLCDDERDRYRCEFYGGAAAGLVKLMPKLEELHLLTHAADTEAIFSLPSLTHLRVLRVDHHRHYPLVRLAENPALAGLTHLLCHPSADPTAGPDPLHLVELEAIARSPHLRNLTHLRLRRASFGDAGVREIIDSGLLGRLEILDLRYGLITDRGAEMLAARPELRRLQWLDLTGNQITYTGLEVLRDTRVSMRLPRLVTDSDLDYHDYEGSEIEE
jgi:uncharacterized protein (TIGR02996 family)